jgi:hypothetical protein
MLARSNTESRQEGTEMKVSRLASITAAALVLGAGSTAVAHAAFPASPATGVWSGKTHQDLAPLGPDADWVEWKQHIVIRTYGGRLSLVAVNVRYTCPDETNPMAGDVRIYKSWPLGRGPVLNPGGSFQIVDQGVSVYGKLGRAGASGRFDTAKGGCAGKGSWQAARKF